MNISETLARLRKERKLTQPEVADYITRHTEKKCSAASVSSWENGVALPPVPQFLLLCELYEVWDIQETFRGVQYSGLAELNALGQSRVTEYIAGLRMNPMFVQAAVESEESHNKARRTIKLYDIPVAAGFGEHLHSASYTEIEVDETVPEDADFAVRVSGDSMAPRFRNRQVVFIREQNVLEPGDIGIFSLNGEAFIKKLGSGELISLNPKYLAIPIGENDSLHIFGKVVK